MMYHFHHGNIRNIEFSYSYLALERIFLSKKTAIIAKVIDIGIIFYVL